MKHYMLKIFLSFVLVGCSGNLLTDVTSADPDYKYLLQAKVAINLLDYPTAIQLLTVKVTSGSQAKPEFKETLAIAYAGKCGLNFASFVTGLAAATTGSAFRLMMTPFVGVVVDPASCLLGLNKMESIAPVTGRTANQNAFVAVLGMALMGSQTRASADIAPANGDGTVDTALCSIVDADINNIVLGFGFLSKNISYLSTQQIGSSSQTSINSTINQCTAIAGANCTITDPALITAAIRDTMRDLLNTQEYGLGAVVTGGNPVLVVGACP